MSNYPVTKIEAIARVCHEANRAYCQALGDMSQPNWYEAPVWQRESACNGVRYHLGNPAATPENSHEKWCEEKRASGWTWGPVKSEAKREHPCFLPYDQLPAEQRAKDYIFRAIVNAMR